MASGRAQQLEREIAALAERFADAAREVVAAALERSVERFLAGRAEWFEGLGDDTSRALVRALRAAIARSADAVAARLRDPDLWLDPLVAREPLGGRTEAWGWLLPDWLVAFLRRLGKPSPERTLRPGDLDSLNNRVWLALLNAADPLDAVLEEFGLSGSARADLGGAHFGLQPATLRELDPGGRLLRLWRRYVSLYDRYRDLGGEGPDHRDDG